MPEEEAWLTLLPNASPSEITSRRQLANRTNAKLSTGPRTPEGKQRVSLNALTHGLTSTRQVLPIENQTEFDEFVAELWATLQPGDALESALAERAISCLWRLRRAGRIEFEILAWACEGPARRGVRIPAGQELGWSYTAEVNGGLERISVLEQKIERSMYRALNELRELQAVRTRSAAPKVAIDVEVDVIRGQTSGFDFRNQGDGEPIPSDA